MKITLVVEIFDGLCSKFGRWTAFGARISQAYLHAQLAQTKLNKYGNCIADKRKLGNNITAFNLMILYLVVEILDA